MKIELQTWDQHNVLQVAVDHLVDHIADSLTDTAGDEDINGVRYHVDRLINAAMLKERLAALGADNGN